MTHAPILIQVYNREKHFKECIESLSKCKGAELSTLYISSDAPKHEKDIPSILAIREFCSTITGFKEVILFDYDINMGPIESFYCSINNIFKDYDRLIYSEDDNVFSPNFLEFVNEGLNFYSDQKNVFSICGYLHPFQMPSNLLNETFASPFTSAWGMGIWRDKYLKFNSSPKANYFLERKDWKQKMPISWHELIERLLLKGIPCGDVAIEYHCMKNSMVNIFPPISLVCNKGNDGSGMHSGVNSGYSNQIIANGKEKFIFKKDINFNSQIINRQRLSIDFPFQTGIKLYYNIIKRYTIKYIRDFVVQKPKLKMILKKFL